MLISLNSSVSSTIYIILSLAPELFIRVMKEEHQAMCSELLSLDDRIR